MKVVCIMQARIGSTRLPGKVLKEICGKTVLEHDIDRLRRVNNIDEIIIATTVEERDIDIVKEAERLGVKYFRGSEEDVLLRYYLAAIHYNADVVVRVTSDCPLLDSEVTKSIIQFYLDNIDEYDYVSNTIDRTYPRGLDTEVFSFKALEIAYKQAISKTDKEHVTPYIWKNSNIFKLHQCKNENDYSKYRWTLDTKEDFKLIKTIYNKLYNLNPCFTMEDILNLYQSNDEFIDINSHVKQKHEF